MAMAWRIGGVAGLALLKGALVFATMALVWSRLRDAAGTVRLASLGVVVLGAGSVLGTLRPQLWSLLIFVILCQLLASRRRRATWWLPLLFAIWANVHGAWVVGLAMLGLWAPLAVWSRRDSLIEWTLVAAASAAATLCTPYGVGLWRFLWETVGFTRDLADWQPILTAPVMNWLPVVVVAAAAAWLLAGRDVRDRAPTAAVLALLAYSSWRVSRIGPLFVVCAAALLGPAVARRWPAVAARPARASEWRVAIGVAAVALAGAAWMASISLRHIAVPAAWAPPAPGARLLAAAQPGRLVTFFDWGEYAIWHFGPRLRVSMDGRRETVYSEARLEEHNAIVAGTEPGLATLAAWRAEYIWLPARSGGARRWLAANGYRIELDAPDEFVAVRDDLPRLTARSASDDGRRSFPE
jgi:hypothetical protein